MLPHCIWLITGGQSDASRIRVIGGCGPLSIYFHFKRAKLSPLKVNQEQTEKNVHGCEIMCLQFHFSASKEEFRPANAQSSKALRCWSASSAVANETKEKMLNKGDTWNHTDARPPPLNFLLKTSPRLVALVTPCPPLTHWSPAA